MKSRHGQDPGPTLVLQHAVPRDVLLARLGRPVVVDDQRAMVVVHVVDEHGSRSPTAARRVAGPAAAGPAHSAGSQEAELAERSVVVEVQRHPSPAASSAAGNGVVSVGAATAFGQEAAVASEGVAVDPQAAPAAAAPDLSVRDLAVQPAGRDEAVEEEGVGDVDPDAASSSSASLRASGTAEQFRLVEIAVGQADRNAICAAKKESRHHLRELSFCLLDFSAASQSSSNHPDTSVPPPTPHPPPPTPGSSQLVQVTVCQTNRNEE